MDKLPFPSAIEIENFKCFGRRVTVPLAPITLLYGENSAGKSAIIQLLCMLRQSLDLGSDDTILVSRDARGMVDLGRYPDYVHDHDVRRDVSVSFSSREGRARGFTAGYDEKHDAVVPRSWRIKTLNRECIFHTGAESKLPEPPNAVCTDLPCEHARQLAECAAKHPTLVLEGIKKLIRLALLQQHDPEAKADLTEALWAAEPFKSAYAQIEESLAVYLDLLRKFPSANELLSHPELLSYRLYCPQKREEGQRVWQPQGSSAELTTLSILESWLLAGASNIKVWRWEFQYPEEKVSSWWGLCQLETKTSTGEHHVHCDGFEVRSFRLCIHSVWTGEDQEAYHLVFGEPTNSLCVVSNDVTWADINTSCDLGLAHGLGSAYAAPPPLLLPTLDASDIATIQFRHASGGAPAAVPHPPALVGLADVPDTPSGAPGDVPYPRMLVEDMDTPIGVSWVGRYISLGPLRQEPARWYEVYDLPRVGVGRKGEHTAEFLRQRPELQDAVNGWLKKLGIDYRVRVDKVVPMDRMPALGILNLTDLRRDGSPPNTIADVGMGISQVLPIVTECLCEKEKWIGIEQPELHIHPRLQTELGSLFTESYKEKGNRFIIETHSEHLMLRIQKLIRKKKLKPEDVAVLYVSRGEDGSNVQRLRLNDQGEFLDPWPAGFFPERVNEIFGD